MFLLSRLQSLVRLSPLNSDWQQPLPESLVKVLNRKLANKVMHEVGLVIAVYDILDIGTSFIFPGDGAAHTKVIFRAMVFRPFPDEILLGKIKSCTSEGVHVSIGFFDDILIPPEALQHPYRFDDSEQAWIWEYPKEDGDHHDLYMDPGEEIRFRVSSEIFVDTSPTSPEESMPRPVPGKVFSQSRTDSNLKAEVQEENEKDKKTPYRLIGCINEPGLGLVKWWNE